MSNSKLQPDIKKTQEKSHKSFFLLLLVILLTLAAEILISRYMRSGFWEEATLRSVISAIVLLSVYTFIVRPLSEQIEERKRTEKILRLSGRDLNLRNRIANVFLTTPDKNTYKEVLLVLLDIMESQYGVFGYVDPEQDGALVCFSINHSDGDNSPQIVHENIVSHYETWGDTWVHTLKEKKGLYFNETNNLPIPGLFMNKSGIKNTIITPIIYQDEFIGIIAVANKESSYNDEDQSLLATIANFISPVLQARLERDFKDKNLQLAREELQHNYQAESALNNLLHLSWKMATLEELLQQAIEQIVQTPWFIKNQMGGAIFMAKENAQLLVLKAAYGISKEEMGAAQIPFGRDICGQTALSGKIQFYKDCDQCHNSGYKDIPHGHFCVPIRSGDKFYGVLSVYLKKNHLWQKQQEDFLWSAVDVLAIIIERKQGEEALREERDKAQRYLDVAGVIVVTINKDQTVSLINKKGCELLGYSEWEILGKNWFDNFIVDRVKDQVRADFENMIKDGSDSVGYYETRVQPKKEKEKTIGWYYTILRDEDGKPFAALNSGQDITGYKQAKREIQLLAKFPAESPTPVLRITKEGAIQFANKSSQPVLKALGNKTGELVTAKWRELIKEIYASQITREIELKCKNQFFLITITPFRDSDYLYVYGRDITSRKQAEIELTKYRHHLEELVTARTSELEASNQELQNEISERKLTEKKLRNYQKQLRDLASELSLAEEKERRRIAVGLHDHIGQELYLAKLNLEMLNQTVIADESVKSAPAILKSIKEVTENIDETIQKTRSLTFDISPPILYELGFEPALKWLADQIQKQHGISSSFEDDKKPKPLDDEVRVLLYQSVRELLTNVVKHAKASTVKIAVLREEGNIRINIIDNGVGFDTSKISSPATKNSGFGLFSIRERLDYLGGQLQCESKPNSGAKMSLVTPLKLNKE